MYNTTLLVHSLCSMLTTSNSALSMISYRRMANLARHTTCRCWNIAAAAAVGSGVGVTGAAAAEAAAGDAEDAAKSDGSAVEPRWV